MRGAEESRLAWVAPLIMLALGGQAKEGGNSGPCLPREF